MFADFSKQRIKHKNSVLHAYDETPRTNHLVIKRLRETDAQAFVIKVDKHKVIRRDVDEFYNDLTIRLLERVFEETGAERLVLLASRKDTKASSVEQFNTALKAAFHDAIEVEVRCPREEKCLQVVDCVSWGLFRKYESDDEEFYRELEPILHEYDY
jgi:hypothetical protein